MTTMKPNWGECFFDHFAEFLKDPVDRTVFRQEATSPAIQILAYDGLIKGCRIFCSLGLTHFLDEVGQPAEVFVPVDDGLNDVPVVVANALYFMVQNKMSVGRGTCVSGLEAVKPGFASEVNKSALYLTRPYLVPDSFSTVDCGGRTGRVYLGIFVTSAEAKFVEEHGGDAFEGMLAAKSVDPYHLRRPSMV